MRPWVRETRVDDLDATAPGLSSSSPGWRLGRGSPGALPFADQHLGHTTWETSVDAEHGSNDPAAGADPDQVRCHCGAVLADRIDGRTVVIDGVEFQFRRRTDKLTCPACGHDHPRKTLRAGTQDEPSDTGQRRRREDRG